MRSNWDNRAKKLHNRRVNKSFSKPFKQTGSDPKAMPSKQVEKARIRKAQRAKYNYSDDENEV